MEGFAITTTQLQLHGDFIDRLVEDDVVNQRMSDGYVNATAMCKACGKKINDYGRLGVTTDFLKELSSETGIPVLGLVQSIKGGPTQFQGTWVHPQVAINLAQWLSPKFAVAVSSWVFEWMTGSVKTPKLPYHLRRYMANMHNVPYGYFSMLNEVTLALIGPLEQMGYTVSSGMVPDGSLGKTFSKHLRELGHPVDDYPKYPHRFEDGRVVDARAYPNELIGELRKFFTETWLKERSRDYFKTRDAKALPYLERFLSLPNYREVMGYIEISSDDK